MRALSILLVMVAHFSYSHGAPFHNSWLTDTYAYHGVLIFFVISGYLITTLLQKERKRTGGIDIKQFYIRRAYRILPVAYFYLLVVAVVYRGTFSWRELAVACAYLSSYALHLPWCLSHLWSLSVEEQFYLVWPLAAAMGVVFSRRFALATLLIAPLARFFLARHGMSLGALRFFPSVADSLATGCLLALYQTEIRRFDSFLRWRGFPAIWAFTLSIPILTHYLTYTGRSLWPLPQLLTLAAVTIFNLCVALCMQSAILSPPRILNTPILVWIGTLSYSLYIWQMPFSNPQAHFWGARFPQNIIFTFAAASASFYFVEKPFLRLRDRRARPKSSAIVQPSIVPSYVANPKAG